MKKIDFKLELFIQGLIFISLIALFFVFTMVPVSAETLTRNLDSNAKLWQSAIDSEDILRVPTNGFNIIQNVDNEGYYYYNWGPVSLKGYSNPTRYNTDLLYSAYVNTGNNCVNDCDIPVLFNISWHIDIDSRIYQSDLTYQTMIAWVLNNYNHTYINFTDNNNKTWHTKLSTRVLQTNQTTENKGSYSIYHFYLNVAYSLTLYNVDTINYIDINIPNPQSDWDTIENTLGSTINAVATLYTKTFAYSYMPATGGSNGTDGSDESQEQIQQLQQQTNEKLNDIKLEMLSEAMPDTLGLGSSAGWLPAGPVDSILNLPLSFFNGLNNALSIQCQPINAPLPFVQNSVTIPCVNTLFNQIPNFNTLWSSIGLIASAFILYKYLLHLYQWVDDTLTFRENNWQDWGGI